MVEGIPLLVKKKDQTIFLFEFSFFFYFFLLFCRLESWELIFFSTPKAKYNSNIILWFCKQTNLNRQKYELWVFFSNNNNSNNNNQMRNEWKLKLFFIFLMLRKWQQTKKHKCEFYVFLIPLHIAGFVRWSLLKV